MAVKSGTQNGSVASCAENALPNDNHNGILEEADNSVNNQGDETSCDIDSEEGYTDSSNESIFSAVNFGNRADDNIFASPRTSPVLKTPSYEKAQQPHQQPDNLQNPMLETLRQIYLDIRRVTIEHSRQHRDRAFCDLHISDGQQNQQHTQRIGDTDVLQTQSLQKTDRGSTPILVSAKRASIPARHGAFSHQGEATAIDVHSQPATCLTSTNSSPPSPSTSHTSTVKMIRGTDRFDQAVFHQLSRWKISHPLPIDHVAAAYFVAARHGTYSGTLKLPQIVEPTKSVPTHSGIFDTYYTRWEFTVFDKDPIRLMTTTALMDESAVGCQVSPFYSTQRKYTTLAIRPNEPRVAAQAVPLATVDGEDDDDDEEDDDDDNDCELPDKYIENNSTGKTGHKTINNATISDRHHKSSSGLSFYPAVNLRQKQSKTSVNAKFPASTLSRVKSAASTSCKGDNDSGDDTFYDNEWKFSYLLIKPLPWNDAEILRDYIRRKHSVAGLLVTLCQVHSTKQENDFSLEQFEDDGFVVISQPPSEHKVVELVDNSQPKEGCFVDNKSQLFLDSPKRNIEKKPCGINQTSELHTCEVDFSQRNVFLENVSVTQSLPIRRRNESNQVSVLDLFPVQEEAENQNHLQKHDEQGKQVLNNSGQEHHESMVIDPAISDEVHATNTQSKKQLSEASTNTTSKNIYQAPLRSFQYDTTVVNEVYKTDPSAIINNVILQSDCNIQLYATAIRSSAKPGGIWIDDGSLQQFATHLRAHKSSRPIIDRELLSAASRC